jgi:hypothetical protein
MYLNDCFRIISSAAPGARRQSLVPKWTPAAYDRPIDRALRGEFPSPAAIFDWLLPRAIEKSFTSADGRPIGQSIVDACSELCSVNLDLGSQWAGNVLGRLDAIRGGPRRRLEALILESAASLPLTAGIASSPRRAASGVALPRESRHARRFAGAIESLSRELLGPQAGAIQIQERAPANEIIVLREISGVSLGDYTRLPELRDAYHARHNARFLPLCHIEGESWRRGGGGEL